MTARPPARAHKARAVKKGPKKARPVKKKQSRPKKKGPRITSKNTSTAAAFQPMEQVTVICTNCGREFTLVKIPGLSTDGMICSRCSFGEMQLPSD